MAYSNDLRERVIAAIQAGTHSWREAARTFQVSKGTVDNWMRRWHATHTCQALPPAGGRPRTLAPYETLLRETVAAQPDITLDELCTVVADTAGHQVSPSMMSRELTHLALPRKKKSQYASQQDTPTVQAARTAFAAVTETFLNPALERLKFLDESGVHLNFTRAYGRAAPGVRVAEGTPYPSGSRYTVVAALGLAGVEAPWVFEGAMDAVAFRTYVTHVLVPHLCAGDVVILDNLSAHKAADAHAMIEACGAHVLFLPPYSPDFNPIELCWAKVKQVLRTAKARTEQALVAALQQALAAVTPEHAEGWFAHCGYDLA